MRTGGSLNKRVRIEHIDGTGGFDVACEAFRCGKQRIANVAFQLGRGFAVAGQHARGIEPALADQDHGAKAARLAAGGAWDLLGPGGVVGVAVLVEFDGAS